VEELNCEKCGVLIEWAGVGRKPKYCVDHRQKQAADKVTPTSRRKVSTQKSLEALRAELTQTLQGAGALLLAVDRYDGLVVIQGAPKLVDALISLAEINPSFRKFLESGTKSVVWMQLGTAVAAMVVPILAHHAMVPVDEVTAYQLFHGPIPDGVLNEPTRPEPKPEPVPPTPTPKPEPSQEIPDNFVPVE
jgi:hypothetical protein